MTPWQAPLAAGVYWALQNLPGPRLASAGPPRQLNHIYVRACLNQPGPKYRYDLVEEHRLPGPLIKILEGSPPSEEAPSALAHVT